MNVYVCVFENISAQIPPENIDSNTHTQVRRRVEDSIEVVDNRVSTNPFASYLLPSSSETESFALFGVIRDVLSSPLCALLMRRIFDDAFQVYLEDIKTRIVFKGEDKVLVGTALSFLCIGNFKGSFGMFVEDKNSYLNAFSKSRALADYVSAIYQSSVLPE